MHKGNKTSFFKKTFKTHCAYQEKNDIIHMVT